MSSPATDPLTGRPAMATSGFSQWTYGRDTRYVTPNVVKEMLKLEKAAPTFTGALGFLELPGTTGAPTTTAAARMLSRVTAAGHQWQAELHGQSALRFQFLSQGKRVSGAWVDIPLQMGRFIQGKNAFVQELLEQSDLPYVKSASFMARPRAYIAPGGAPAYETVGQAMFGTLTKVLSRGAQRPEDLVRIARRARSTINKGFENMLWSGGRVLEGVDTVAELVAQAKANIAGNTGTIYDVYQAGVVGVYAGPGISAPKLIEGMGPGAGGFPFVNGQLVEGKARETITEFLTRTGPMFGGTLTDVALKSEAALAGNLGLWKLGQLVPFGMHADPARQNYQRWGVAQLIGSSGRKVAPVTTPEMEAAKEFIARKTGGSGRFGVRADMAIMVDPRFEEAVAASGGGVVITKDLASRLSADVTYQAEVAAKAGKKWTRYLQRGAKGEYISPTGVGTPLITPWFKGTVAAIPNAIKAWVRGSKEKRVSVDMAIGWTQLLKGKDPAALREMILSDVMTKIGPVYKGYYRGGQLIRYPGDVAATRSELQTKLLNQIQGIFGGSSIDWEEYSSNFAKQTGVSDAGTMLPHIRVGAETKFELQQLTDLNKAIVEYNTAIKEKKAAGAKIGLRPITEMFDRITTKFGGQELEALRMSSWVARRLSLQETTTKAVGSWVVPVSSAMAGELKGGELRKKNKLTGMQGFVRPDFHPRGTKLKLADITNLELYGTQEARDLAEHYKGLVNRWKNFEKGELANILKPFYEGAPIPGLGDFVQKAKLPGGVALDKLAAMYNPINRIPGGAGTPLAQLTGTLLDPSSPFYHKGVAVNLPEAINLETFTQGVRKTYPTSQIYLPAMEFYRGISPPAIAGGRMGKAQQYVGPLMRAHESLYMALAAQHPNIGDIEAKASKYHNLLGQAMTGKTGILSYLTTARMAHSGYLALVPGGRGPLARELGTALDPFTVQISEATARGMGLHEGKYGKDAMAALRGEGLYGRAIAYPSIGASTEMVYRFKMVKDSELGRNQLRVANYMALLGFRDFDRDMSGVMFLKDREAQARFKAMYEKTTKPMLWEYQKAYRSLGRQPEALDEILSSLKGEDPALANQIKEAITSGKALTRDALMGLSLFKEGKVATEFDLAIARKYTTKTLTGPINWFTRQFDAYIKNPSIGDLAKGHVPSARLASSLMTLFEQNAAIAKGKLATVPQAALDIANILSKPVAIGTPEFAAAKESLATAYLRLGGVPEPLLKNGVPTAITKEMQLQIKAAFGTGGEILSVMNRNRLMWGSEHLLIANQARLAENATAAMNPLSALMKKRSKTKEGLYGMVEAFRAQYERISDPGKKVMSSMEQAMVGALGLLKPLLGLETDDLIVRLQTKTKLKAREGMRAANRSAKEGAAGAPGILQRAIDWWHSTKTPFWQRAGVITGAAVMLGAVAKNLLFPGYAPASLALPTQPYAPPPNLEPGKPISYPEAETGGPPVIPGKPGGIFGRIGAALGLGSADYSSMRRDGMPKVSPVFGSTVSLPGVGLDLGPGIAESPDRPMLLAGPPVGGDPPLPPAIPSVGGHGPDIPARTPAPEPTARMTTPSYMRQSWEVSAVEPNNFRAREVRDSLRHLTNADRIEMSSVMDPRDGRFERRLALEESELSSF